MTTNNIIKLLDVVALTTDLPDCNLWRGQVGTVVEILADGAGFEVEFCDCAERTSEADRNGRTYESIGLRLNQIILLHFEPISPNLTPATTTAENNAIVSISFYLKSQAYCTAS